MSFGVSCYEIQQDLKEVTGHSAAWMFLLGIGHLVDFILQGDLECYCKEML